jgi:hypothetical protein
MQTATLLGGSLEGIDSVRVLVTSNRTKLIPSWVKTRKPKKHVGEPTPQGQSENFINEGGGCTITGLIGHLERRGFRPVRVHQQAGKGDNVRVGISFERKRRRITKARMAELAPVFEGSWAVRGDRNPPIGRVPDHIVLSCHFRGYRVAERANAVGVVTDGATGEAVITLF